MNNAIITTVAFDATDSEKKAIGCLLKDPHKIVSKNEQIGLTYTDFGCPILGKAWEFLLERASRGKSNSIDVLTRECPEKLAEFNGQLKGEAQIALWELDAWSTDFEGCARNVITMSKKREFFASINEVTENLVSGTNLDGLGDSLREAAKVADSIPSGYRWPIEKATNYWIDDPNEIHNLSDPPIIDGLLREREVSQLVGPAKSQKTWFALALACAVARGSNFIGNQTTPKKVLYIDYELKKHTLRKRLSMVSKQKPEGIDIWSLRGEEKLPEVRDLIPLIRKNNYGLIVIDSLYRTGWISEENNNDVVSRELTKLQKITSLTSASLLIVDHTAKGGGKERSAVDSSRGASSKGGFFDSIIALRPQEKAHDGQNRVILDMALRDFPAPSTLPILEYSFSSHECSIKLAGEADKSDINGTNQRVFELLHQSKEGLSVVEISRETGLSESTIRRTLTTLVSREKITESPDPKHKQRKRYRIQDLADDCPEQ